MTIAGATRASLPRPADRLSLGNSGLSVSPLCLGMTASPDTVLAAYEAGVNVFFITADLHWPLYDGIRKGIAKLLQGQPARRNEIVVGVVSYLDNPLFSALQFNEVIAEVPGLDRVDLMIAGAVSNNQSFYSRVESLARARGAGQHGARAIGATFHQRPLALIAETYGMLDISFIRYNSAHPGANHDLFPYLPIGRKSPIFNFKSTMSLVTPEMIKKLNLPNVQWIPDVCDYYRFVLTRPQIDGILCSPQEPDQMKQLTRALEKGPLMPAEETYMIWLASLVHAQILT